MKIYLSPSTQERNIYATGGSEEYWMRNLANRLAAILTARGNSVRIGGTISAAANKDDSNAWGADYHVALHSNAGGGEGSLVLHSGSAKSVGLANAIYRHLAPFSIGSPDDGIRLGTQFTEIIATRAPAVVVEVEFHDSVAGAKHITENLDGYASAIANGILAIANPQPVVEPVVNPRPNPQPRVEPYKPVLVRALRYTVPRMRGADVAEVQKRLGVGADGTYGYWTWLAVRAYQRKLGMKVDGIVGQQTAEKLGLLWRP